MSYEGDFNGSILKNMQPMASLVLRRIFNPYMGLKLTGSYGKLKGSSKDVQTYYPDYRENQYDFSNTLADLSLVYEYNFWPYGTGQASGGGKNVFTGNIPLGVGVKYKIGERLNLGLEWAMHFSLSDELDGVKDPYGIKSTGPFKNTDCYSALQITLTYSFMPKCRTCHNDDE